MIIGTTLLAAIVAAGLATLAWFICERLALNTYVSRWIALTVLLIAWAASPIIIGK